METPRLRVAFGALRCFAVDRLRPCSLPPAPERRFIALPNVRTGIVAGQISALEVANPPLGLGLQDRSLMSALGQKRTLRHVRVRSALPPKADISSIRSHRQREPKV